MALRIVLRDRFDINHPVAHGEVTRIEIEPTNKKATIVVDLFNDLSAFQKRADPFDKTEVRVENLPPVIDLDGNEIAPADPQFDDFFDDAVLTTSGVTPLARAEDFLVAKVARFSGAVREKMMR